MRSPRASSPPGISLSPFELLLRAVPAFAPSLVRLILATCSLRVLNRRVQDEYIDSGRPFVSAVWHKDFIFSVDYFRRRGIVVMVSRSRDGELVARTMHRVGYLTARGSSSAGGAEALGELTERVRQGHGSAFVADGPRGPARMAKVGCVIAARDSGAPLLTFGCHIEPSLRLRNWDRTVIPLPFARIAIAYGDPIRVPAEASREECERILGEVNERMAALEATCQKALETL